MAIEAIGLAIGAVSLAGLFQSCVQCYEYIDRGKTCGRDLAKLMTRLEIEKIRLLMWGESVDISRASEGMYGVFEREQVRNAIYNVLNCIHMVFTDVQELQSRYGLSLSVGNDERLSATEDPRDVRPVQFHAFSNRFQHLLKRNQQSFGILKRGTWVVRDWKKFNLMLDDLLSFNNGLESITNSVEARQRRPQLMQGALESLQSNLVDLRLVQEAAAGNNDSWADAASSIIEQSEVDAADAANSVIEQSEVNTADARILSWREGIGAQMDIDSKSEHIRPEIAKSLISSASESLDAPKVRTSSLNEQVDKGPSSPVCHSYIHQDRKPRTDCYVYCAPCWVSIRTAAHICQDEYLEGKNRVIIPRIRVDERLDPEHRHARTRLQKVLNITETVKGHPHYATDQDSWWCYNDLNYIRRRLHALDEISRETSSEASKNRTGCDVGAILKEHQRTTSCFEKAPERN
ncbi:MAG: hypothetical protein Q9167_006829 [Letrouitia subvulpina]